MKTTPLVPSRPNQSIKNLGNKLPHIGVNKYFSSFQNTKSKANKNFNYENHTMKYIHPEAFPIGNQSTWRNMFLLFLTHIPSHHSHRFIPVRPWDRPLVLRYHPQWPYWALHPLAQPSSRYLTDPPKSMTGHCREDTSNSSPKMCFPTNSRKPSEKMRFPRMKSPNRKISGLDLSRVAVVLVGRLGQAGHVGLFGHRLAIRHHWVAHNEVTLGILVLPWVNPRFQNHPRLVENLDWMIPIVLLGHFLSCNIYIWGF